MPFELIGGVRKEGERDKIKCLLAYWSLGFGSRPAYFLIGCCVCVLGADWWKHWQRSALESVQERGGERGFQV